MAREGRVWSMSVTGPGNRLAVTPPWSGLGAGEGLPPRGCASPAGD